MPDLQPLQGWQAGRRANEPAPPAESLEAMAVVRRRHDGALFAALVADTGGAIPFGVTEPGGGINAWEWTITVILALAVVALALAYWMQATGPLVEWTVRVAGVAWLAATIVVAIVGSLDAPTRTGLGFIFAGVAIAHLVMADRLEQAP